MQHLHVMNVLLYIQMELTLFDGLHPSKIFLPQRINCMY